jgi:hypothetical protein
MISIAAASVFTVTAVVVSSGMLLLLRQQTAAFGVVVIVRCVVFSVNSQGLLRLLIENCSRIVKRLSDVYD